MKLSTETSAILKNFASINPGILFTPGHIVATISPQKNILAEATISEKIPTEFGIYDLNNFLSVNSLFKEGSELEFDDKHVIIKGINGRSKIKYRVTDSSMVISAPSGRPSGATPSIKFTFSKEDLDWVLKTANVLNSPHISIESDGDGVNLVVFNADNDSAHTNSLQMDDVETTGTSFKVLFKTENFKVIPDTYDVEIFMSKDRGFSVWTSKNIELKYWITTEMNSRFE